MLYRVLERTIMYLLSVINVSGNVMKRCRDVSNLFICHCMVDIRMLNMKYIVQYCALRLRTDVTDDLSSCVIHVVM